MSFVVELPNRTGQGNPESIDSSGNIVLIGANGSGKTRLGIWIEQHHQNKYPVHRISAQKALSIPEFAQLKNLEQAEKELIFGRSDQYATVDRKVHDRWGNTPATFLLNDYDKLLSLLFAKLSERDRKHTEQTRQHQSYVPVPDSPIDTIVKVWGDIMPHREIKFLDGKVLVKKTDDPEYHGREMSDGELRRAVKLYRDALPDLCAKHGISSGEITRLYARFGTDAAYGPHFTVTVESVDGKSSTDQYVGIPGRTIAYAPKV